MDRPVPEPADSDLLRRIARIVKDDDPAAAGELVRSHPAATGLLERAALEADARAVLREVDLLMRSAAGESLDTPRIEVRLQGHSVILGRDHAYLMVIIDNHPAFEGDPRFENRLPDGRRYATLGAGPENMMPFFSTLISGVNRRADLSPFLVDTFDQMIQHPDVLTGARTERAVVEQLFEIDARYRDSLEYDIVPFHWSDGYNSNSFISGLLEVTGWDAERPGSVPGWDKPVPAEWFAPVLPSEQDEDGNQEPQA